MDDRLKGVLSYDFVFKNTVVQIKPLSPIKLATFSVSKLLYAHGDYLLLQPRLILHLLLNLKIKI